MRLLIPWFAYPPFRQEGIGGLSVVVWELSRNLARQGCKVTMMIPETETGRPDDVDGVGVIRTSEAERLARGRRLGPATEGDIASSQDRILSIANYGAPTLCRSRILQPKVFRHTHMVARDRPIGSYLPMAPTFTDRARAYVQRSAEKKAEYALRGTPAICVSGFVKNRLVEHGLAQNPHISVIPNGVDTSLFRPRDGSKSYDLIYVGRYQIAKGPDILFRALKRIGNTVKLRAGIVGAFGRSARDSLTGLLGSTSSAVEFLGRVDRKALPDVIAASKLLVVPSRYESFGLPALEAMACGVPVVATKTGGIPELVDETVGRLVPDQSPKSLAAAVVHGLKDDALAESALRNGPRVAGNYDWKLIADRVLKEIEM